MRKAYVEKCKAAAKKRSCRAAAATVDAPALFELDDAQLSFEIAQLEIEDAPLAFENGETEAEDKVKSGVDGKETS